MNKRLKEICKILFATDGGSPIAIHINLGKAVCDKYLQIQCKVNIIYNGSENKTKLIDIRLTDYLYEYFNVDKIDSKTKSHRYIIYDTTYANGLVADELAVMNLQSLRTMYLRQHKINKALDEADNV